MRKVIVNSTPIIALCHINQFELFKKLYGVIYVPDAVYREISAKQDSVCKSKVDQAVSDGWLIIESIHNILAKSLYKTQLHDGEVEVMILAKELSANLVVIDDLNARKHAQYLKLPVTGTLGVLVKSKQLGYVEHLRPLLLKMREHHIYVSEGLVTKCLQLVGEV